jgi:ABC-2 type transport system ATP-binding protein
VVVIDGGRLMRSATTSSMTALTQDVVVEVTERGADVEAMLVAAGLPVRRQGDVLHLVLTDDSTYDVVRDTVVELGVGLVRLQRGRQHMLDMFRDAPEVVA